MKPIITDKGLWVDTRACRDEAEEPCLFALVVSKEGQIKAYDILRKDKEAEHPVVDMWKLNEEWGWDL